MELLSTIWIFIRMMLQFVVLPFGLLYLLIKIVMHFLNKYGNRYYDKRAEKKEREGKEKILSSGRTEEEKTLIRYFIAHDENELSDEEFINMFERDWYSAEAYLEEPIDERGKVPSIVLDEKVRMTDEGCLLRRLPDNRTISSKIRRITIYFSSDRLYIRTLTLDERAKSHEAETTEIEYVNILEVSFQRLHPVLRMNGNESRVLSSTLSILEKGGKRHSWKGMDIDTEPIKKMIDEELMMHRA